MLSRHQGEFYDGAVLLDQEESQMPWVSGVQAEYRYSFEGTLKENVSS